MQLTNSLLIEISRKIERGYALTAVATANYYLKPNCPLRLALVNKARHTGRAYGKIGEIIFNGKHVETESLADAIRLYDTGNNKKIFKVIPRKINLFKRTNFSRRSPTRQRYHTSKGGL